MKWDDEAVKIKMRFCAVCAKQVPEDSYCLGKFLNPSGVPNHLEDCKSYAQMRAWHKEKNYHPFINPKNK